AYGSGRLTPSTALALARGGMRGQFTTDTPERITASHQHLAQIVATGRTVYGVNTGFGVLAATSISASDTRLLQHKILQSHSVGVGDPIRPELVRLMLVTKLHALALGYSGVAPSTLERIRWHLEEDILPVVPEKGSVGASGDLAPLAHL